MYRKVLFHTRTTGCLIKGFFPEALIYFIITTSSNPYVSGKCGLMMDDGK